MRYFLRKLEDTVGALPERVSTHSIQKLCRRYILGIDRTNDFINKFKVAESKEFERVEPDKNIEDTLSDFFSDKTLQNLPSLIRYTIIKAISLCSESYTIPSKLSEANNELDSAKSLIEEYNKKINGESI